jgi:hypothetical protein
VVRKAGEVEFSFDENVRLESISLQIEKLTKRVKLVRNAVLSYTIAVALFVVTSLLIGIEYFTPVNFNIIITIFFLLGMLSVLAGVLYAAYETKEGYSIIQLEIKID